MEKENNEVAKSEVSNGFEKFTTEQIMDAMVERMIAMKPEELICFMMKLHKRIEEVAS